MANFAVFDFDALDEDEEEEERKLEEDRARRRLEAEEEQKRLRLEHEKQERLRLHREAVLAAELNSGRAKAKEFGLDAAWAWDSAVLAEAIEKRLEWDRYGIQALRTEASALKVPLQGVPLGYPLTHEERSMTIERLWVGFIWQRMPAELLKFECMRRGIDFFKDDSQSELVCHLCSHVYGSRDGGPGDVKMELHGVPWTGPLANEQGCFRDCFYAGLRNNDAWESWVPIKNQRQNPSDIHRRDGSIRLGFKSCGPRVRSFLNSFPKFSGEVPDSDAENWNIFDLRSYFLSNGEKRPGTGVGSARDREQSEKHSGGMFDVDAHDYGPRVEAFLKSYPNFSGEVPGLDAETTWSDSEMRAYFTSNGQQRPHGNEQVLENRQAAEKKKLEMERIQREAELKRREAEYKEQEKLRRKEEQRRQQEQLKKEQQEHQRLIKKALSLQVHYNVLGLDHTASSEEVRKTYRKLALQHHPDKQSSDTCDASTFRKVTEAYQTIMQHFTMP